jgi:hypothetical protein
LTRAQVKDQSRKSKVKSGPTGFQRLASISPTENSFGMSSIALEMEALKLSAEKKAHLIDALWRSLDSGEQESIDRDWLAESRDRLNAFRAGELRSLEGEAALRDVEAELIP